MQHNKNQSSLNIQKGSRGVAKQINEQNSFFNHQEMNSNFLDRSRSNALVNLNSGVGLQYNADGTAGNIQYIYGKQGTQHVGSGYSFNLLYIYDEFNCTESRVTFLRGNLRVVNCKKDSRNVLDTYEFEDVVYTISSRSCNKDEFMKIRDGKVRINFCTRGYN